MSDYTAETKAIYANLEKLRKEANWTVGDYSLLMVAGLMVTDEYTADALKRAESRIIEAESTIEMLTERIAQLEAKSVEKRSLK